MILVTVGTAPQPFTRLVRKMDELAGKLNEPVIMQIGHTSYKPKNAVYFEFADEEELDSLLTKANVLISHAGVGVILKAIELGKPIIVVPRLRKFGENYDDHQVETASMLSDRGYLTAVYTVRDLEQAISEVKPPVIGSRVNQNRRRLIRILKLYLSKIEGGNTT